MYRSVSGFLVQWQLLRRLLGLVMHSHIHEHITDSWHIASVRDRAAADLEGAIDKIIDNKYLHPVLSHYQCHSNISSSGFSGICASLRASLTQSGG